MPPIRATPSSDAPSDRTGGTPARTAQKSYGNARLRSESCPRLAAPCRAWALVTESRRAARVLGSDHCRKLPRPARAASSVGPHTARGIGRRVGRSPGPAAPLPFDTPRWHWLLSRRLLTAWRAHHWLGATPSRICRDPRGWDRSARPFFCRLLRTIEQHLIPVDPLQHVIPLGQLSPRHPKGLHFQPALEPALHGLIRRKPRRHHAPPDSCDQHIEHGVQTLPVVVGRTPIPTPHHRWENRLKERPDLIGHLAGKIRQLQTPLSPLALHPMRIKQVGGFVS